MGSTSLTVLFFSYCLHRSLAYTLSRLEFPLFEGDLIVSGYWKTESIFAPNLGCDIWISERLKASRIDHEDSIFDSGTRTTLALQNEGDYGTKVSLSSGILFDTCKYLRGTSQDPIRYFDSFDFLSWTDMKYVGDAWSSGYSLQKWKKEGGNYGDQFTLYMRQDITGPQPFKIRTQKNNEFYFTKFESSAYIPEDTFHYNRGECDQENE